jgi:DNA/RNA-binding domain of Phe-tRNA-synthetase-like protein
MDLHSDVTCAPSLAALVRLGVVRWEGITVGPSGATFEAELAAVARELRAIADRPIAELPGIQLARSFFRAIGLDPTRQRPSSEALIRRLRRGQDLYRICNAVDAINLASVRSRLPYGLYDLDQVCPPVTLRLGLEGEWYPGIGKDRVNVAGRFCLSDHVGPFGNPTSDAARTRVRETTTRLLLVQFGPAGMEDAPFHEALDTAAACLDRHVGGREADRRLLP